MYTLKLASIILYFNFGAKSLCNRLYGIPNSKEEVFVLKADNKKEVLLYIWLCFLGFFFGMSDSCLFDL